MGSEIGKEPQGEDILVRRLLRLEERMDLLERSGSPRRPIVHPAWPFTLGCMAAAFGLLGMGVPRHPYQYLFAGLLLLIFYHRRVLYWEAGKWRWPLAALNFANIALFFLIVLGGGAQRPFSWVRSPVLSKNQLPEGGSWYSGLLPDYSVRWRDLPGISDWTLDITRVQVFLLIATMAGALFRLQGFTSVTALALLIISIPLYLTFSWDWVVLFLILAGASLYVQYRPPDLRRPKGW